MRRIMAALALALAGIAAPQPAAADRDERWDGLISACVNRATAREDLQQCVGVVATPCIADDNTTLGMSLCISNEADQWGALLDPLVTRSIAREAERADSLRASQTAWSAWVDAECSYRASAAAGGSAQQPMLAECYRDLTAERVILFEWNERYPP